MRFPLFSIARALHFRVVPFLLLLLTVMILAFVSMPVFAAGAPAVSDTVAVTNPASASIPYGDWITQLLTWGRDGALTLILGALGLAARRLPAQLASLISSFLTEQTVGRAVDWGIAVVEGAVKGGKLDLPQTNAVIVQAENYVIVNAPLLAKWLGATLRPKILARLSGAGMLMPETNGNTVGSKLPAPAAAGAKVSVHVLLPLALIMPLALLQCTPQEQALVAGIGTVVVADLCQVGDNQFSKIGNPTQAEKIGHQALDAVCSDPKATSTSIINTYNVFAQASNAPLATTGTAAK